MTILEHLGFETLPDRILGMQRLEDLFNQKGYLICQATGKRLYNFDEIVAIFIPLSPANDQVMAVQDEHAQEFIKSCFSTI